MSRLNVALIGRDPTVETWLRADPNLRLSNSLSTSDVAVVLERGNAQVQGVETAVAAGLPTVLYEVPTEHRMVELATSATAPVICWWAHRFTSALAGLRKEILGGRIGLPTDMTVQIWLPAPATPDADPFPMLGAAADLATWLTGCRAVNVQATKGFGRSTVRLGAASLMLKQHIPVAITAGWAWGLATTPGGGPTVRATAVGTHGVMNVATDRPAYLLTGTDGRPEPVLFTSDEPGRPSRELSALLADAPVPTRAAVEITRTVGVMQAMFQAAETGSVQVIAEP